MALKISRGRVERAQKVVVYGPEGIGKTTFSAAFPDALFIDLEQGTLEYDVARTEPPVTWTELLMQIGDVAKERPCATLAVDTADMAEQMCMSSTCAKNGWDSIDSPGFGKGHTAFASEFRRLLSALDQVADSGINVVVTAHAAMRKFELPDEAGQFDRWELKLHKKTAPMVKEWCDALLFVNYKTYVEVAEGGFGASKGKATGGKRVMYASHHPCWDAKNRWGLDGEVPFEFSTVAPFVTGAKAREPRADGLPRFWDALSQRLERCGLTPQDVADFAVRKGHFEQGTKPADLGEDYVGFVMGNFDGFAADADDAKYGEVPIA